MPPVESNGREGTVTAALLKVVRVGRAYFTAIFGLRVVARNPSQYLRRTWPIGPTEQHPHRLV